MTARKTSTKKGPPTKTKTTADRNGAPFGGNRTGTALAPERTAEMQDGGDHFGPTSDGTREDLERELATIAGDSDPVGTLPAPREGSVLDPSVESHARLLGKLGERLAFERMGTRLYEGMLAKFDAHGSFPGGPTREELEEHRAEERSHFDLLCEVIEELGGDSTAVTPDADLAGVASRGIGDVIHDPRTSLLQSLEALLIAELTDEAAWDCLVKLAEQAGRGELVEVFELARSREEEHLDEVKRWISAGHGTD